MSRLFRLGEQQADRASFVSQLRRARFQPCREFIENSPTKPVRILDIGGTVNYWEIVDCTAPGLVDVVILNLDPQQSDRRNFICVKGDATALPYPDDSFDLVFSNAVLEHLATFENQARAASEARRVGRSYFVQTPSYWFPWDIHYQYPLVQFAPRAVRDRVAPWTAGEIRLMRRGEIAKLFPDADVKHERLMGFTKAYIAYRWATIR